MSLLKPFAVLVGVFAIAVGALTAQTTGTITGTVTDSSGAVVPGAGVTARSATLRDEREARTNGAGQYSFPFLPPGDYSLEFSHPGFSSVVEKATLNVTERIEVDAKLTVSATSEKIEVAASGELLQTATAALGSVVGGTTLRELPLSSRNFTQLLSLSPGTASQLNDAGALGRGTQIISSGGARTTSNAIQIDGVDGVNIHTNSARDNGVASNGTMIPSPEAVQEFKVQTSMYDAQSGRSGGANIALVTRSGTADFHGSAFEFFRNTELNANSFFFNKTGQPRPLFNQNQFGGTFGGPVIRRKTYFFLSYQGTRQRNGLSSSSSLQLPQIPLDRSAASLGRAFAGKSGSNGGLAIAADGSNISPVALAIMNLKFSDGAYIIPSPQTAGLGVNYAVSVPARFTEDQGIANIDHQFGASNRLSVRTMIAYQPTIKPLSYANIPGFGTTQDFNGKLLTLTDTHILSSNMVNEARAGVSRIVGVVAPEQLVLLKDIGMNRFNSAQYPDIPDFTISDSFVFGYDANGDQGVFPTTWNYMDTLSWSKGRHQIRAGAEYRRYDDNYYSRNRYRGSLALDTFPDFLLGRAGSPIADGGNGTGFSNINSSSVGSGIPDGADRITDLALFAQDDWKVNSRFTVNAGIRWDYLGFPVDKYGRRGNFDFRLYQPPPAGGSTTAGFVQTSNTTHLLPGIPRVSPTLLDHSPDRNFAPRIGFAYKLTGKLILRGGFGIFYDRLSNQLGLLTSQSAPNYVRSDLAGASNINSTLQNPFPNLPLGSQFPIQAVLYAPPYTTDRPALAMNSVDPNLKTPYLQHWALNVQWSVMRDMLLEVGYVGTKGTNLPDRRALNQAVLASTSNPVNGITVNTAANTSLRVPYLGFSPSGLLTEETAADSRYNSLQASITRRMNHGLRFLAAYTYSKSMDDTSGAMTTIFTEIQGDESQLGANKGVSDFDRTQRAVANFSYDIPHWGFAQNTAIGNRLFGGWQISGIGIWQSGAPFSVLDTGGAKFYGTTLSRASFAPGATLANALKSGPIEDRLNAWFDRTAFTRAGNFFGNAGRNILRGPRQRNLDFSVTKIIPINDRFHSEFRAEFFNVFNLVNFAAPNNSVSSGSFGVIQKTEGNPRVIQLALRLAF